MGGGGAADGHQQLPTLRDATRWAASFLRMARLALTGAAPVQPLAEVGIVCNPHYRSVSTTEEDAAVESEAGAGAADLESEQLLAGDQGEEDSRATEESHGCRRVHMNKQDPEHIIRHWPERKSSAFPSEGAAATAESEPFLPRRGGAKRANDAEVVGHPFGCDRRGREAASQLLL